MFFSRASLRRHESRRAAAPARIRALSEPKILKNASKNVSSRAIACVRDSYLNWKWKVWILPGAPARVFSEHVISTAALPWQATGLITYVFFFY